HQLVDVDYDTATRGPAAGRCIEHSGDRQRLIADQCVVAVATVERVAAAIGPYPQVADQAVHVEREIAASRSRQDETGNEDLIVADQTVVAVVAVELIAAAVDAQIADQAADFELEARARRC